MTHKTGSKLKVIIVPTIPYLGVQRSAFAGVPISFYDKFYSLKQNCFQESVLLDDQDSCQDTQLTIARHTTKQPGIMI